MKRLIGISVFVLMASSIVYGYTYSDYTWTTNPANGHQYTITLEHSNWAQAEEWAQEVGGHLVTINDDEENAWVAEFSKDCFTYPEGVANNIAWIGLEYKGAGAMTDSNSWEWQNGEPVTFWNPDWTFPQDGVHMYICGTNHDRPGTWNNGSIIDTIAWTRGVIEVPEPATIVLLTLGGLLLRKKVNKNI
jgi:hypothetical protein